MKVLLYYTITENIYHATLSWYVVPGDSSTYESVHAYGNTPEEAKEKVIAIFKKLPPSEELDL